MYGAMLCKQGKITQRRVLELMSPLKGFLATRGGLFRAGQVLFIRVLKRELENFSKS